MACLPAGCDMASLRQVVTWHASWQVVTWHASWQVVAWHASWQVVTWHASWHVVARLPAAGIGTKNPVGF